MDTPMLLAKTQQKSLNALKSPGPNQFLLALKKYSSLTSNVKNLRNPKTEKYQYNLLTHNKIFLEIFDHQKIPTAPFIPRCRPNTLKLW